MIIYGRHAVREALRGRRRTTVGEIVAVQALAREPWLAKRALRVASAAEVEATCGSTEHQGICATVAGYPYVSTDELLGGPAALLVALDEVQDPQNLGAICRTAECSGVDGLVICERRAAEVTPAVCRASAGAVEHLRIARARNLADFLDQAKRSGSWTYGASLAPGAQSYADQDYTGRVVVVFGAEGQGLRRRVAEHCDVLIALPMRGQIASLNVGAAVAGILYGVLAARDRGTST